ncbi:MAG: penicillin acylase family protein [Bryobacteraceae bacterium]
MNRIFKYINYLVAAVLLVAVIAAAWIVSRSLPQTSGSISAPVSAVAAIQRDSTGVPHVAAATEEDAYFLQGYATAQDRLFQMDLARRLGAGEVAEVAGRNALESDLEARRLRMRGLADHYARVLDPADHAPLAAYARGVNYFLETHRGRLPLEFRILGYDPAPWTIADSLLVGLQMYRGLTSDWRREAARTAFLREGGAKAAYLLAAPDRASAPLAGGAPGSNAFAVAGARTASGKPLLASDPHLSPSLPPVWHQVRLKAGDLDVAGVTLPGLPGVSIGHNRRIAWGITSLQFDEMDLVANPGPVIGTQREAVAIRGAGSAELSIPVTAKGPLIPVEGAGVQAVRWSGAEHSRFAYVFPELDKARNWQDFRRALSRHPGPGFQFAYADSEGNIGTQAAGKLPARSAGGEWTGSIPFEDLPSRFNPPEGIAVAANDSPFPPGYPYTVAGRFAEPYRANQIRARLQAARSRKLTPADLVSIQRDVYDAPLHAIARLAARAPGIDSAAAEELSRWNGQMDPTQAAPYLADLIAGQLRRAAADSAVSGKGETYDGQAPIGAVLRLFREKPAGWFADWNTALAAAVNAAIDEGRRAQGDNIAGWRWGKVHASGARLPVLSEIPWIGGWFRVGPVEEAGGANTVRQLTARAAPTMRMAADTGNWEASLLTLPGGESGLAFSGHWDDQWADWQAGHGVAFPFERFEAKNTLRVEPVH